MENEYILAEKCYNLIDKKSSSNQIIQALSGIGGWPYTIGVDVAVIPLIYIPLINDLRKIYGLPEIDARMAKTLLSNLVSELLMDLVVDKAMGNIPLIGIYFNAICAKTMTWRLGILFTMISAVGKEISMESMKKTMRLIRQLFPQNPMTFKKPTEDAFLDLILDIANSSFEDYDKKIDNALNVIEDN